MLKYFIAGAVVIILIAAAFFIGRSTGTQIEIQWKTKTVQKTVFVPKNCDDLQKCYDNDLTLDGVVTNNWLVVSCGNECKSAERSFKLRAVSDYDKNVLIPGVQLMYTDGKLHTMYGGSYYRYLFNHFGVGAGAFGSSSAYSVQAGILVSF